MRMRPDRRIERLVLLPFAMGCVSESSVALAHHHHHHPTRTRPSSSTAVPPSATARSRSCRRGRMDDDEESLSSSDSKSSTTSSSTSPSSKISARLHRILKTFKSTFAYKEEEDDEEEEMMIGVPTDVKHVTHIGWNDGVGSATPSMIPMDLQHQCWDSNLTTNPTTTTTTRVNNPIDLEHQDDGSRDDGNGNGNNNNLITHGQYQPDRLLVSHHRRNHTSYNEDRIDTGALAAADPLPRRPPVSVVSPASACT